MVVSNNIKVKSVSLSISRVVATLGIVICHIISYYTIIPGHDILGHWSPDVYYYLRFFVW